MRYRVHRIKDTPRELFRWAAHTGGIATVKVKDYDSDVEVEAASPYAAWKSLAEQDAPLRPGDLLECLEPASEPPLQIAKYIGFEPAQWFIPEPKPESVMIANTDSREKASNGTALPENAASIG